MFDARLYKILTEASGIGRIEPTTAVRIRLSISGIG